VTDSITPPPELVQQWIKECDRPDDPRWQEYEQDIAARAALAQPEPQGPSELELEAIELKLWDKHRTKGYMGEEFMYDNDFSAALDEYRDLLAQPAPVVVPVPVSERLPGPEDVNDDGEVWVEEPAYDYPLGDTGDYDSEPGRWVLRPLSSLDKRFKRRWLPHWALPVPGVEGADA
jgi:hypothetical protein